MLRVVRGIGVGSVGIVTAYLLQSHYKHKSLALAEQEAVTGFQNGLSVDRHYKEPLPTRAELLKSLKEEVEFDVLVIGGGATGAGVALDACTRGLKTALVEKDDYASGASSKSTKLLHGGVRYLQKAIMNLDKEQYNLVCEALSERAHVLASAPHLSHALPIMLPVYRWWLVPYYWVGIKAYDVLAGRKLVKSSYFLGRKKALEKFPMLKADNLAGVIVYYDGQQDDARMNLSVTMTAIREGAKCVNHVEVVNLLFKEDESGVSRVCGARVRDAVTGEEWDVSSKSVVNATGPFTDSIRKMNNNEVAEICQPAAGVHVTLPHYYCSKEFGLLDPETKDGRIIFVLPWEGHTIAGTTDRKCAVTFRPEGTKEEINFIMEELQKYLNDDVKVRNSDILSAWCGIRPLVTDPNSADTQSVSRNHVIEVSPTNLISIAGGKWTTYRSMASDTVDAAVKTCGLSPSGGCCTDKRLMEGSEGWGPTYYIRLVQEYGLDAEVAEHLSHAYGTKAPLVAELAASCGGPSTPVRGRRLIEGMPYIEADVRYAVIHEYACKAVDVISRRLRLAFLNVDGCRGVLPRIIDLMATELGWDEDRKNSERGEAEAYLQTYDYKHIFDKDKLIVPESTQSPTSIVDLKDLNISEEGPPIDTNSDITQQNSNENEES